MGCWGCRAVVVLLATMLADVLIGDERSEVREEGSDG
jgi:hypothetical protein